MIFGEPLIYDMEDGYDRRKSDLGQSQFSGSNVGEEHFMVLRSSTHTEDSAAITQLGYSEFGHHGDYDDSTTQDLGVDEIITVFGTDFDDGMVGCPIVDNAANLKPCRKSKRDKGKLFENSDRSDVQFLEENFGIVQIRREGRVGEAIMEGHFSTFVPSHTMDLTFTSTLECDNFGHHCDKDEDEQNDKLLCVGTRRSRAFDFASNETFSLPLEQEKHKYYLVNFEDPPIHGDVVTDPDGGKEYGDHLRDSFSGGNSIMKTKLQAQWKKLQIILLIGCYVNQILHV